MGSGELGYGHSLFLKSNPGLFFCLQTIGFLFSHGLKLLMFDNLREE